MVDGTGFLIVNRSEVARGQFSELSGSLLLKMRSLGHRVVKKPWPQVAQDIEPLEYTPLPESAAHVWVHVVPRIELMECPSG